MAFRCRRLPPELINELIKFVDGPACRKRLISTNTLCYFLLHNTKRAHCWLVDANHLREEQTRYGPNRLLALIPSLDHHRSAAKFFCGFALVDNDGPPETARDYVRGHGQLRFYISLNGGEHRAVVRAFFGSSNTVGGIATTYNCSFLFIPLEDERCLWDLALVCFQNDDVMCENWDALLEIVNNRLTMIRTSQPLQPIGGQAATDSPPNLN
uniref:F-box domain-containing protein n=1 Tax=Globodera rostochiensis TaxID=31243 RepID=A0A914HNM6_GLORO